MKHDLPVSDRTACQGWLTALSRLRNENISLKEQLSGAVRKEVSATYIMEAEQFLQYFIDQDQVIDLLRYDIVRLLAGWRAEGLSLDEERQYHKLEQDTNQLIATFSRKKHAFARFLAGKGT